jgi:hypothetical protein
MSSVIYSDFWAFFQENMVAARFPQGICHSAPLWALPEQPVRVARTDLVRHS